MSACTGDERAPRRAHEPEGWDVSSADYPEHGTVREKLGFALRLAMLAPSSHNTQPWRFRLGAERVELWADPSRQLAVCDPDGRELVISCGAALFHLSTAIRFFGHRARVKSFPDPDAPRCLARVGLGDIRVPDQTDCTLYQSIARRRTNRGPFETRPVPTEVLAELRSSAEAEGTWLHVIETPRERNLTADLIAQADREQGADPAFRTELAAWLRANDDPRGDGIPGYSLGIGDAASHLGPLLVRSFAWGDGRAARDRELAEGSPTLLLLGTKEETAVDWLAAGRALSAILLRACAHGLSASYLNQVIQVHSMRSALASCLGLEGYPQLVLRMGYGVPVAPTPRRRLDEVLEEEKDG